MSFSKCCISHTAGHENISFQILKNQYTNRYDYTSRKLYSQFHTNEIDVSNNDVFFAAKKSLTKMGRLLQSKLDMKDEFQEEFMLESKNVFISGQPNWSPKCWEKMHKSCNGSNAEVLKLEMCSADLYRLDKFHQNNFPSNRLSFLEVFNAKLKLYLKDKLSFPLKLDEFTNVLAPLSLPFSSLCFKSLFPQGVMVFLCVDTEQVVDRNTWSSSYVIDALRAMYKPTNIKVLLYNRQNFELQKNPTVDLMEHE